MSTILAGGGALGVAEHLAKRVDRGQRRGLGVRSDRSMTREPSSGTRAKYGYDGRSSVSSPGRNACHSSGMPRANARGRRSDSRRTVSASSSATAHKDDGALAQE